MKGKPRLFKESLKLVWKSAPGWATVNTAISVIQSVLPLAIVYLIKLLIDAITEAAAGGEGVLNKNLIMMIAAVVIVYLADELTDSGNFVRKQSVVSVHVRASACQNDKLDRSTNIPDITTAIKGISASWR